MIDFSYFFNCKVFFSLRSKDKIKLKVLFKYFDEKHYLLSI